MLTFAEEIMLLLLDDDAGTIEPVEPSVLRMLLSGAVLMDLALQGRIDTDLEKLFVVDATPTGDDLLDPALAQINASQESHDAQYWVVTLSEHGNDLEAKALERLVGRGILKVVDKKFLWVFGVRRYPAIDNREEREVKHRILDVLLSDTIPDPRDIALICLADSGGVFNIILRKRELERAADRIEQVRKLDLIGQAMSEAIQNAIYEIAMAMATVQHQ